MTPRKITVKEIAELSGVSVATVSRVINQNGRFSAETEQRVRQVIEKYDYQPNQLAKGLRQRKTDAIGVTVPSIANEFFSDMVLAMQTKLFAEGYSLTIYNTNNSLEMERQCHSLLAAQSVGGIISVNSREDVRAALKRPIPTVYIDRFIRDEDLGSKVASISSDNMCGGRLAAQELLRAGCKKIVMVTANAESPITKMRSQGFVDYLASQGMPLPEERIFTPHHKDYIQSPYEEGREIMTSILGTGIEFDGLFCQTDWLAIGSLEVLREHGVRVPDEVSVVGYDDVLISRFGRPPLTTVRQDSTRIGERAAEIMVAMTQGETPGEQRIVLPVELVRRDSTRR